TRFLANPASPPWLKRMAFPGCVYATWSFDDARAAYTKYAARPWIAQQLAAAHGDYLYVIPIQCIHRTQCWCLGPEAILQLEDATWYKPHRRPSKIKQP